MVARSASVNWYLSFNNRLNWCSACWLFHSFSVMLYLTGCRYRLLFGWVAEIREPRDLWGKQRPISTLTRVTLDQFRELPAGTSQSCELTDPMASISKTDRPRKDEHACGPSITTGLSLFLFFLSLFFSPLSLSHSLHLGSSADQLACSSATNTFFFVYLYSLPYSRGAFAFESGYKFLPFYITIHTWATSHTPSFDSEY